MLLSSTAYAGAWLFRSKSHYIQTAYRIVYRFPRALWAPQWALWGLLLSRPAKDCRVHLWVPSHTTQCDCCELAAYVFIWGIKVKVTKFRNLTQNLQFAVSKGSLPLTEGDSAWRRNPYSTTRLFCVTTTYVLHVYNNAVHYSFYWKKLYPTFLLLRPIRVASRMRNVNNKLFKTIKMIKRRHRPMDTSHSAPCKNEGLRCHAHDRRRWDLRRMGVKTKPARTAPTPTHTHTHTHSTAFALKVCKGLLFA